jgi:hypothetical protein
VVGSASVASRPHPGSRPPSGLEGRKSIGDEWRQKEKK